MTKNKSSETKEILANTLFDLLERKPFPKISVNELCENSMIVRSTFYLHFQDKYELLSYCLDRISMELEALMKTHETKDFFIVFLTECEKKERVFYNLFETEINEELMNLVYQYISRNITKFLEEKTARANFSRAGRFCDCVLRKRSCWHDVPLDQKWLQTAKRDAGFLPDPVDERHPIKTGASLIPRLIQALAIQKISNYSGGGLGI